ncbi:MAG: hypothetical protein JSS66_12915 [Armatimonadetes bacterium]|nr:hypothetical protein [Armatimonadota bacterium]
MPKAVFWYGVFCFLAALLNLALLGISVWFVARHDVLANEYVSSRLVLSVGLLCGPLSLAMVVLNLWLGLTKRLKNAWSIHLGNIAVGIMTLFLLPIGVPLLIAWFRPEVRAYYAGLEN